MTEMAISYDVELDSSKVIDGGISIVDLVTAIGLETSRSNVRRMVEQGGVRVKYPAWDNSVPIASHIFDLPVVDGMTVFVGLLKSARIKLV